MFRYSVFERTTKDKAKISRALECLMPDLEDEDVKEILHNVLTELYYSKGKKVS